MQGPSELGASGEAREVGPSVKDLARITVPTLVIGARPRHDGSEAHGVDVDAVPDTASTSTAPNGSHMDMYDDQETYMNGLIAFLGK